MIDNNIYITKNILGELYALPKELSGITLDDMCGVLICLPLAYRTSHTAITSINKEIYDKAKENEDIFHMFYCKGTNNDITPLSNNCGVRNKNLYLLIGHPAYGKKNVLSLTDNELSLHRGVYYTAVDIDDFWETARLINDIVNNDSKKTMPTLKYNYYISNDIGQYCYVHQII